jgi:hypothetical protein
MKINTISLSLFSVRLSSERQISIFLTTGIIICSQMVVSEEAEIEDRKGTRTCIEWLWDAIDTLLDEALIRQEEKDAYYKNMKKKRSSRAELESTVAYWQTDRSSNESKKSAKSRINSGFFISGYIFLNLQEERGRNIA